MASVGLDNYCQKRSLQEITEFGGNSEGTM